MVENNTKYNYGYVDLEEVMKNIDEYIIPKCQEACKAVWNKNIETFMVSNNDDTSLYILFKELSKENLQIMKNLIDKQSQSYFFDEFRHYYGIKVDGTGKESSKLLRELTIPFIMQDVCDERYMSSSEFLEHYKNFSIHDSNAICMAYHLEDDDEFLEVSPTGNVFVKPEYRANPDRKDKTLREALIETGKVGLYVSEEQRVYCSQTFLNWHRRYLNRVNSREKNDECER